MLTRIPLIFSITNWILLSITDRNAIYIHPVPGTWVWCLVPWRKLIKCYSWFSLCWPWHRDCSPPRWGWSRGRRSGWPRQTWWGWRAHRTRPTSPAGWPAVWSSRTTSSAWEQASARPWPAPRRSWRSGGPSHWPWCPPPHCPSSPPSAASPTAPSWAQVNPGNIQTCSNNVQSQIISGKDQFKTPFLFTLYSGGLNRAFPGSYYFLWSEAVSENMFQHYEEMLERNMIRVKLTSELQTALNHLI